MKYKINSLKTWKELNNKTENDFEEICDDLSEIHSLKVDFNKLADLFIKYFNEFRKDFSNYQDNDIKELL